ncbi:hypothetical protein ABZ951_09800 [Streptomyces sp. NPDC046215]|uniref:TRADD-N-associated membrane domain-containing protein n=1 Tax=Streptomyces TaxID=1883 RepID=UPI0031D64212
MNAPPIETWVSAVGVFAAAGAATFARALLGSYKRDVAENRERLHQELRISSSDGQLDIRLPPEKPAGDEGGPDRAGDTAEPSGTTHNNTVYNIQVDQGSVEERRAEREEQTFSVLLADYYAHGLTQAQRSSVMSLVFSAIGCLILFVGVGLAIWRSETSGDVYAAMVTNVTGLVTGVVGILFHRQARQALEHLEGQTKLLRDDMRSERGTRQAIRLVEDVADPALKARLQAALILQFTDATLPDVPASAPGGHHPTAPLSNGGHRVSA